MEGLMGHHKSKPKRSALRKQIEDEAARRQTVQAERDGLIDQLLAALEERDTERAEKERLAAALRTIKRMRPSVNGSDRARQIAIDVLG